MKAIEQYVFRLAECYTKMPEVSRLRTGSKGGKEGAEIRAAIASLNAINEFLALKEDEDIDDQQRIKFVKRCLATKGDLVDGMRKLFSLPTIGDVRTSFGLPNDVKKDNPEFNSTLASDFFSAMCQKSRDHSLIGQLIETYFDFPYKQPPLIYKSNGEVNISLSKKAVLEEQDINTLIMPAAQCLAFTLGAFNKIEITDCMITSFLESIIQHQGWSNGLIISDSISRINQKISEFNNEEDIILKKYFSDKLDIKQKQKNTYTENISSEQINKKFTNQFSRG